MSGPMRFELTEQHVKLLRRAWVDWENCETGAPAIDCKRPYGNSDVPGDVAEILGWHIDDGGHARDESRERALELHRETQTALQVILATGSFEPGVYELAVEYRLTSWRRVQ